MALEQELPVISRSDRARHRLAEQCAQLAQNSPSGSLSELEKLERPTEVDALDDASRARRLAIVRLRREQAARRQTLTAPAPRARARGSSESRASFES